MTIRFLDASAKEIYLEKYDLSVSKVLEEAESQYRYLKSRGQWYSAKGVSDNATPRVLLCLKLNPHNLSKI